MLEREREKKGWNPAADKVLFSKLIIIGFLNHFDSERTSGKHGAKTFGHELLILCRTACVEFSSFFLLALKEMRSYSLCERCV